MTIEELHYDLKYKLDKVDSLDTDNILPAEIDWILNEAINLFVKQRYDKNNPKKLGFEGNQKRIDDLKTLVIKSPSQQPAVVPVNVGNNTYEVKLSSLNYEYLFLVRLTTKLNKTNCGYKVVSPEESEHDDLNTVLLNDPFRKPSFEWQRVPYVFGRSSTTLDDQGSIYLYTDGTFTITEVYPEYLKTPNKVSLGGYTYLDGSIATKTECDLPKEAHREIIDIAVNEISRIIDNPNFMQLKSQKLQINE